MVECRTVYAATRVQFPVGALTFYMDDREAREELFISELNDLMHKYHIMIWTVTPDEAILVDEDEFERKWIAHNIYKLLPPWKNKNSDDTIPQQRP